MLFNDHTVSEEDIDSALELETENGAAESAHGTPWGYEAVKQMVAKAKGAATKTVLRYIGTYMRGTKVIFVMGKSGTGKTTILKEMTGLDLRVGKTMESGTREYEICPAIIDKEQYLFIDTPGFGAADIDDDDNFKKIVSCLEALQPFVNFCGVLFVFGQPETRLSEADLRTIRFIKCFCGPEFFDRITFITSRWDDLKLGGFRRAWSRGESLFAHPDVHQILHPPGRVSGGSVYHHGFPEGKGSLSAYEFILQMEPEHEADGPGGEDELNHDGPKRGDELRSLIQRRYRDPRAATLQVLVEMNKKGVKMFETEAARALRANLITTAVQIHGDQALIREWRHVDEPTPAPEADATALHSTKLQQVQVAHPISIAGPEDDLTTVQPSTETQQAQPTKKTLALPPGDEQVPKESGERPDGGNQPHSGHSSQEPGWIERLAWWFRVAYEASSYFKDARHTGYESTNRKGGSGGPAWKLWDWARSWWA